VLVIIMPGKCYVVENNHVYDWVVWPCINTESIASRLGDLQRVGSHDEGQLQWQQGMKKRQKPDWLAVMTGVESDRLGLWWNWDLQ